MRARFSILLTTAALCAGCWGNGTLRIDSSLSEDSAQLATIANSLELGGGVLVIDTVQIAVSETEFEGRTELQEAELGAAVIDVATDGTDTVVTSGGVASGKYHTFGMELTTSLDGSSIVVGGTYMDAPFTFGSAITFEAEYPLDPPVDVPSGGDATVAVTFDIAAWFTAADGSVIDPTDPANQNAIDTNIRNSVAAHAAIEAADGNDKD